MEFKDGHQIELFSTRVISLSGFSHPPEKCGVFDKKNVEKIDELYRGMEKLEKIGRASCRERV